LFTINEPDMNEPDINEPDFFFNPDLFIKFDPINNQNKTISTSSKLYKSNMARTDAALFENEQVTFDLFLENNVIIPLFLHSN
ncbi:4979_t:CDS:2, partial [Dentiscutata erythropus]